MQNRQKKMAADYLRSDQIGQFQDAFKAFATSDGQVSLNQKQHIHTGQFPQYGEMIKMRHFFLFFALL